MTLIWRAAGSSFAWYLHRVCWCHCPHSWLPWIVGSLWLLGLGQELFFRCLGCSQGESTYRRISRSLTSIDIVVLRAQVRRPPLLYLSELARKQATKDHVDPLDIIWEGFCVPLPPTCACLPKVFVGGGRLSNVVVVVQTIIFLLGETIIKGTVFRCTIWLVGAMVVLSARVVHDILVEP